MSNIYSINDELTPTPPSNNTPEGNTIQQQLSDIEAQRQLNEQHINDNYNRLIADIEAQGNAIDALHSTAQRTHTYDPHTLKAGRNMSALYDSLQLIGTLAAMSAKNTPPPPQLSSATQENNNLAYKLQQQQAEADNRYATNLRLLKQRQLQAHTDLAKQRRQAKADTDRLLLNNAKHYDTLQTRILEGERNRQNRTRIAIERNATAIKQSNIRAYGGGGNNTNKYDLFDFDGHTYRLSADKRKDFSSAVGNLVNNSNYAICPDNFSKYGAKLSGVALHMSILRAVLNQDIDVSPETYNEALSIFETYFTPTQKQKASTTPAVTDDDFSQYIVNGTDDDFSQYITD